MGGIPLRLIDTAGLRAVVDPVEGEGVRRAHAARAEADLVLLVLDGSRPPADDELAALERARSEVEGGRTIVVRNKSDLPRGGDGLQVEPAVIDVSALTGEGIDDLRRELKTRLVGAGTLEDPIITDARHASSLEDAKQSLSRAAGALRSGMSEELVLEDLREAMRRLGEITGEFTTEDLYDRIFSTFCIGK